MGYAGTTPGTPLATATSLRLSTAGAEATVAIGLQRLSHNAVWVGVVGDDEVGRRVLRDLRAEGVDVRFTRASADAPTGFMLRDHRTPDHTSVSYYRRGLAGSMLEPADVQAAFDALDHIDVLHITGITAAVSPSCRAALERAVELATERGITVSFDVNYRSTLSSVPEASAVAAWIVERTDILFVGDDELHLLMPIDDPASAARTLLERGPQDVVVKLGARGSLAATRDGESHQVSAPAVTVADVIGAGDSFVAGYLAARAEGLGLPTRLSWATTCAACTVGTHGDWEGLPRRAEIEQRAAIGRTLR